MTADSNSNCEDVSFSDPFKKDASNNNSFDSAEAADTVPINPPPPPSGPDACPVQLPPNFRASRRGSVSAESYQPSRRASQLPPRSDPPSLPASLQAALQSNLLFRSLDDDQRALIVAGLKERPVTAAGEVIIRQGEEGDNFYLVEQGRFSVDVDGREVVQIGPGGSFGELALMYNTARAATVTSLTPGRLLQVDRGTFRRVIIDLAYQKRCKYMDFLRTVPLLQSLSDAEIGKVADALEAVAFPDGHVVIRQGDPGDSFYIVSEGVARVVKDGVHVATLQAGDHFGELALLERQPRAASVIAEGPLKCLTLTEPDFVRLIGPLKKQ